MDDTSKEQEIPQELYFPKTISHKAWEQYLGRYLSHQEKFILEGYRAEKYMNQMLDDLYRQCIKKKIYYVPLLTSLDGNCLFESLLYHKIGSSVEQLRRTLALIMYLYKSYKGFFPNREESLEEMFVPYNCVEYVSCKKKVDGEVQKEFYKYTYNVMCQDLSNNHSWTRLNTQLVLMVLSYIYKLEFVIVTNRDANKHEDDNIMVINTNASDQVDIKKIYLGILGESHYVPLDILNQDEALEPLYYNEAKTLLLEWASDIEKKKIANYLKVKDEPKIQVDPSAFMDVNRINNDENEKYTVFF